MIRLDFKQAVKKVVLFVIVVFFIYIFVPLLTLSISTNPQEFNDRISSKVNNNKSYKKPGYWVGLLNEGPMIKERSIRISIKQDKIEILKRLKLPGKHMLVDKISGGMVLENISLFVEECFGKFTIDSKEISFIGNSSINWTISDEKNEPEMNLEINSSEKLSNEFYLNGSIEWAQNSFIEGKDELIIDYENAQLISIHPTPDHAEKDHVIFKKSNRESPKWIYFTFSFIEAGNQSIESVTTQSFLYNLNDRSKFPLVNEILMGFLSLLPMFIFIIILFKYQEGRFPISTVRMVYVLEGLMIFYLSKKILGGMNGLLWVSDNLTRKFSQFLSTYFHDDFFQVLKNNSSVIFAIILGMIASGYLYQKSKLQIKLERNLRVYILFFPSILFIFWIGSGISLLGSISNIEPGVSFLYIIRVLLFLILWFLYNRLFHLMAGNKPPLFLPLSALMVTVFFTHDYHPFSSLLRFVKLLSSSFEFADTVNSILTSISLNSILLISFLGIVYYYFKSADVYSASNMVSNVMQLMKRKWLRVAFFLAVIFPMNLLMYRWDRFGHFSSVINFSFFIGQFIFIIWILFIVILLYRFEKDNNKNFRLIRGIGIIGAAGLFFEPTRTWLYIPVTFFIGLFMLFKLVERPKNWKKIKQLAAVVFYRRDQLLEKGIKLNLARFFYNKSRKKMLTKLVEGDEENFKKAYVKIESQKKEQAELLNKAIINNRRVNDIVLAYGPYKSNWDNAMHGTKYSLLIALPWMILYLFEYLNKMIFLDPFPFLSIFNTMANIIIRWSVVGFFLGYFFPYLKGKNGLMKSLWLFAAIVIPAIPLMILNNFSTANWQSSLFWVSQIFIQCVVLGLFAFDYTIIKRSNYGWQMLFEIHGIGGIGLSISSILLAIGASVTTILTGQATKFIAMALKLLIPEFPSDLINK